MLTFVPYRPLRTLLVSATISVAASLAFGWPRTTRADHDNLTLWVAPGTKVGPTVVAEARLVRDDQAKTGWALELKARNSGRKPASCNVLAQVSELRGMPMARVLPPPRTVWQQKASLDIAARSEVVRHIPVPARLALQLEHESARLAPPPPPTAAQARAPGPQARRSAPPPPPPEVAVSSLRVRLLVAT